MKKVALSIVALALSLVTLGTQMVPVKADGGEGQDCLTYTSIGLVVAKCLPTGYANGSYRTTAGDELLLVCMNPGYPVASGCFYTYSLDEQICSTTGVNPTSFFCKQVSKNNYVTSRGDEYSYTCTRAGYPVASGCNKVVKSLTEVK